MAKKPSAKKLNAFIDDHTIIFTPSEMEWLKDKLVVDPKGYTAIERTNQKRIDRQELLPALERLKARGLL